MSFEAVAAQGLAQLFSESAPVVVVILIGAYVSYKTGAKLLDRCEKREEVATLRWEESTKQVAVIQLETVKQLSDVSTNLKEIRQDIKDLKK